MVMEFISVLCLVGIVVVGILIMVQVVTFAELVSALGRLLLFLAFALVCFWIARTFLFCIAIPWLVSIKALLGWVAIAIAALVALSLIVRQATSGMWEKGTDNKE